MSRAHGEEWVKPARQVAAKSRSSVRSFVSADASVDATEIIRKALATTIASHSELDWSAAQTRAGIISGGR
jgi:hypothetical protein